MKSYIATSYWIIVVFLPILSLLNLQTAKLSIFYGLILLFPTIIGVLVDDNQNSYLQNIKILSNGWSTVWCSAHDLMLFGKSNVCEIIIYHLAKVSMLTSVFSIQNIFQNNVGFNSKPSWSMVAIFQSLRKPSFGALWYRLSIGFQLSLFCRSYRLNY